MVYLVCIQDLFSPEMELVAEDRINLFPVKKRF